MKFDMEFTVICGKEFSRHGKAIRGAFKIIAKIAKNGWSDRAKIIAHVTSDGDVWHEVEFRTICYLAKQTRCDERCGIRSTLPRSLASECLTCTP